MYGKTPITGSTKDYSDNIKKLKKTVCEAEAIVIGAGAGLSTSAGFTYSGERFDKYFADFGGKYNFKDMYSGGFYPYKTQEEMWAYWSRYIFINRYMDAPKPVYAKLFELIKDKDYFVITTNVDHCFQKAGFDKERLFYTQGDYGLFQCSVPCQAVTYDNGDMIRRMYEEQKDMKIPSELIPRCPNCGKPLTMNLRSDDKFVEDEGWHKAAARYEDFIRKHDGKVLYLELGVGYNTPGIIKYPFWQMTAKNPDATYACINYDDAECPDLIKDKAILIEGDIGKVLEDLKGEMK